MAADRRIGAVGGPGTIFAEFGIQRITHAVQALKFESAVVGCGQFEHGGHRQRIMGGKLRKNPRPQRQQFLRAGDVVQIRHRLAREHRIAVKAALLCALDLGVPIGALDETHHHPAVQRPGEIIDIVDHARRTLLVGLNRKPEAIPLSKRCVTERGGDDVERQFQPVGLFGVHGEIQIISLGALRKLDQPRHQLRHHAAAAHGLKARMQRGELDRDAGPVGQGPFTGGGADGVDRARIGIEIARRIIGGARAFAEHVERIARCARRCRLGASPGQRGFDRLAEHEMAAHQPHRLPRGGAHGRHAQPLGEPPDRALRGFARLDHPRRHAQRPG